jgi:hypothetical protein
MATSAEKQWRFERTPCNRPGTVLADGRVRTCTVIDTSLTGVRICLHEDGMLPTNFVLVVDRRRFDCEIVWRKGRELGARVRGYR